MSDPLGRRANLMLGLFACALAHGCQSPAPAGPVEVAAVVATPAQDAGPSPAGDTPADAGDAAPQDAGAVSEVAPAAEWTRTAPPNVGPFVITMETRGNYYYTFEITGDDHVHWCCGEGKDYWNQVPAGAVERFRQELLKAKFCGLPSQYRGNGNMMFKVDLPGVRCKRDLGALRLYDDPGWQAVRKAWTDLQNAICRNPCPADDSLY